MKDELNRIKGVARLIFFILHPSSFILFSPGGTRPLSGAVCAERLLWEQPALMANSMGNSQFLM
jgi:hypothetical protein